MQPEFGWWTVVILASLMVVGLLMFILIAEAIEKGTEEN